jgi:hypothetical protein
MGETRMGDKLQADHVDVSALTPEGKRRVQEVIDNEPKAGPVAQFPAFRHHPDLPSVRVNDQAEADALGPGWSDTPSGPANTVAKSEVRALIDGTPDADVAALAPKVAMKALAEEAVLEEAHDRAGRGKERAAEADSALAKKRERDNVKAGNDVKRAKEK